MQVIERTIEGIDGSSAGFTGYVRDNSPEMDPDRTRPALLILPGGAYAMTSERESEPIALTFLTEGFQTFVLRYSCAPSRYPTALIEAAEAVRLIRANAGRWHVAPDHVAVLGFSAGGHLAANLATSSSDAELVGHGIDPAQARPDALMLAYPVITTGEHAHRRSISTLLGPEHKHDDELLDLLAIERHIDASTPPVFVWHTMSDPTVPVKNTLMLIQACRDAGVSVEAHLFPRGGHGLSLATTDTARNGSSGEGDLANVVPEVRIWPSLAADWLRRTFAA